jgi:hypothetical protein
LPAAGCGACCACEDEESCGAGVVLVDERSEAEGRWEPCDAVPGAGRRMAAFGLKAVFLFNMLSVHRPAACCRSLRILREPRAVAHCPEPCRDRECSFLPNRREGRRFEVRPIEGMFLSSCKSEKLKVDSRLHDLAVASIFRDEMGSKSGRRWGIKWQKMLTDGISGTSTKPD